jgi:hypothetical protein
VEIIIRFRAVCPKIPSLYSFASSSLYGMIDDQLPPSERQGVPHHLIDVRDAKEDFSAGDFHDLARQAARDIISVSGMSGVGCE